MVSTMSNWADPRSRSTLNVAAIIILLMLCGAEANMAASHQSSTPTTIYSSAPYPADKRLQLHRRGAGIGLAERLIRALNLMPTSTSEDEMQIKAEDNRPSSHAAALVSRSTSSSSFDGAAEEGSPSGRLHEKRLRMNGVLRKRKQPTSETEAEADQTVSSEELGLHAGYFDLNRTYSAKMFYFFFESRGNKTEDPVLLWTTGGPGCGSELALFYENGPFHIVNATNLTLVWNDYGWDQVSNIIFVDQPVGTGFSYTTDYRDIRHDQLGVSEDLYDFLQTFLDAHSDYRTNGLFVTGESYAGHYIPALVSRIYEANKQGNAPYINLKGFAIGNGLTQPDIQYEAYADYALSMGLIGTTAYARIKKRYTVCAASLSLCESEGGGVACAAAYLACDRIFNSVVSLLGNTNYYDIRKECKGTMCYDFSDVTTFLNDEEVQEALGVDVDVQWVACSSYVYEAMMLDWMRNAEKSIPAILDTFNVSMLIYAGEYDLVCNWLGNSRWVAAMNWTGREEYNRKNFTSFSVDGEQAGSVKNYGPLTFMKVHNAGHMVPMDQPKAALEMIKRWTRGTSLAAAESDDDDDDDDVDDDDDDDEGSHRHRHHHLQRAALGQHILAPHDDELVSTA